MSKCEAMHERIMEWAFDALRPEEKKNAPTTENESTAGQPPREPEPRPEDG